MTWIAPTEKDTVTETLEKRLWASADPLRANSGLIRADSVGREVIAEADRAGTTDPTESIRLKAQARDLEATIAHNVPEILQA